MDIEWGVAIQRIEFIRLRVLGGPSESHICKLVHHSRLPNNLAATTRRGASEVASGQRLQQVFDQIVRMFESDRYSQQVLRCAGNFALA